MSDPLSDTGSTRPEKPIREMMQRLRLAAELVSAARPDGDTVLIWREPDGEVRKLAAGEGPISIGRDSDNRLAVADPAVSRRHCLLRRGDSGWEIEDRGSRNGTFLNGRRVDRAFLRAGDLIVLAGRPFLFLGEP